MPTDFLFDRSRASSQLSANKREINLFDVARLELRGQRAMRRISFRNHQTTARFFVQAMHDAWPFLASDSGKFRKVMKQRIHERVFALTGAGMNNEPGRF